MAAARVGEAATVDDGRLVRRSRARVVVGIGGDAGEHAPLVVGEPPARVGERLAGARGVARLAERRARLEQEARELGLVDGDLLGVWAGPVGGGRVAKESTIAPIAEMLDDGVEGGAHDSRDGGVPRRAPASQEQEERVRLGLLGRAPEAAVLRIHALAETRDERLHQVVRPGSERTGAVGGEPPGTPVGERGLEEREELGRREKGAAPYEVALRSQERGGGQPAHVIAAVHVRPRVGVHAHGNDGARHGGRHGGMLPCLLVHSMAGMAPPRGEREQTGLPSARARVKTSSPHSPSGCSRYVSILNASRLLRASANAH